MALKRQLPPTSDGAGSSRPSKSLKSTPRFENTADLTRQELEALVEKLQAENKNLQAENKELKEKMSLSQGHVGIDEITSEPADDGRYEVRILGTIKERVYINSNVEGKDGKPLKVEILYNGNRITQGPFASATFEIVVVQGDFCINDEGWSAEEFEKSLVKTQMQVGSSSVGARRTKFSNGEAVLSGLKFKISSHCAEWRLGIRVRGSFNVRVLEAISEYPFKVFDPHSRANEKPHTPSLTDPVECLKKVGKKRASELRKEKVCTIEDFLLFFHLNPSGLLQILGIDSKSESWETMTRHANDCVVGPNLYSYRKNDGVLFFNSVYDVVGAKFGNRYSSFDKLSDYDKKLVNELKNVIFENIKNRDFTVAFEMVNGQHVPVEHDDDDALQHDEFICQVQEREGLAESRHFIGSQREILGSQDAFPQMLTDSLSPLLLDEADMISLSPLLMDEADMISLSPLLMDEADTIEDLTGINAEPNNGNARKRLMLVIFVVLSMKNLRKRAHLAKISRILNFVRA